nr:zinc finger, CCHC-type [Tanacetum cinerariifolium]
MLQELRSVIVNGALIHKNSEGSKHEGQKIRPTICDFGGTCASNQSPFNNDFWFKRWMEDQQAEQELLQTTRDFHSYKHEEGQSVSSYVLKMKGYIDNLERLGHPVTLGLGNYNMHILGKTIKELHAMLKLHEQTLPKNNVPALHAIRVGHWKRNCPQYIAELLKKKKNAASRAGGSGLRASRKLKSGALSLYVGTGQREAVETIVIFYL